MTLTSLTHRTTVMQQQARRIASPAPASVTVGPVLAVDGSNWSQYDYTDEVLSAWRAAGVGLVLEQAIDPPAPYPRTRTRQHVGACVSFGMPVAPYAFWWSGVGTDYLKRQLDLLDGYEGRLVRSWGDFEDTTVGFRAGALRNGIQSLPAQHLQRLSRQYRPYRDHLAVASLAMSLTGLQDDISQWLEVLDTLPVKNRQAGVYSGAWYEAYVNLSPFAARPHWASQYDGIADPYVVTRWGGLSLPVAIKQYAGDSNLAGYGGVDLNIVSADEVALF